MASDLLLPLFPLQLVLFPGAELPLHIFEPRYRVMVGEAIEQSVEFGVILTDDGRVSGVGCTALVEKVTERFDDGRFNVVTRGRRRFQAIEFNKERDCLRAKVEYLQDVGDEPASTELLMRAHELAVAVAATTGLEMPKDIVVDERAASYAIAAALPLDMTFKQQLLEQRNERERLRALVEHLEVVLKKGRMTERMQKLAGTNGHGRREIE